MLADVKTRKFGYFGHVMLKPGDCLERDYARHITRSKNKRKSRDITSQAGFSADELMWQVEERLEWRQIVHSAANPRTEDSS